MCVDMCVDMCADMCIDMFADMCIDRPSVLLHIVVGGRGSAHVATHTQVCAHVYTHVYMHVYALGWLASFALRRGVGARCSRRIAWQHKCVRMCVYAHSGAN